MPASTLRQIDYAPPPSRVRRYLRRAVRPLVYLGLALLLYWFAPRLWYLARVFHAYQQCTSYTAPPNRVVYSDIPEDATALPASDPAYVNRSTFWSTSETVLPAAPWSYLYSLISPPGSQPAGTAFLAERTTPEGTVMLVAVNCTSSMFHVHTFTRARPYRLPMELDNIAKGLGGFRWNERRQMQSLHLRVFAGQPDPADPSHFTIPYEIDGKRGVIDGWLRNSGSVDLEVRRESITPRPPASVE